MTTSSQWQSPCSDSVQALVKLTAEIGVLLCNMTAGHPGEDLMYCHFFCFVFMCMIDWDSWAIVLKAHQIMILHNVALSLT